MEVEYDTDASTAVAYRMNAWGLIGSLGIGSYVGPKMHPWQEGDVTAGEIELMTKGFHILLRW